MTTNFTKNITFLARIDLAELWIFRHKLSQFCIFQLVLLQKLQKLLENIHSITLLNNESMQFLPEFYDIIRAGFFKTTSRRDLLLD